VNVKQSKKFSERFLYYYHHLLGFAFFGVGNVKKAESNFRRSRNFEKQLDKLNLWIQIEHYFILLVIQILQQNYESYHYEFGKMKLLIKKREITEKSILDALDYLKSYSNHAIHKNDSFMDSEETKFVLSSLTKKTNLLSFLRFDRQT
jgi:hypothetical protein